MMVFPEYNDGLIDYIHENDISDADKNLENAFHFRHKLINFSPILTFLQDDGRTKTGSGQQTIKNLMIYCSKRGLHIANEIFPEIKEILKLARKIDQLCIDSSNKRDIIYNQKGLMTFNQLCSSNLFFPGHHTHDVIQSNNEYLGMTKYAMSMMYFHLGVMDYDFPVEYINRDIEDVLNSVARTLYTRKNYLENQFENPYIRLVDETTVKANHRRNMVNSRK